jgi:hypothetical protein
MIDLKNTTLVAIGSTKIEYTLKAIDICKKYANFYDIKYLTDADTEYTIKINRLNSIREYDNFIIQKLPYYIDSDFVLSIHWDGFIVNPYAWTDSFFEYDYIGAPWHWWNNICGNGGFCMKSKKFLETQKILFDNNYIVNDPDDVALCVKHRNDFINKDCKYAPPNIAYRFSTEYGGYYNYNSFGFHDLRVNPQFKHLIEN